MRIDFIIFKGLPMFPNTAFDPNDGIVVQNYLCKSTSNDRMTHNLTIKSLLPL